MLSSFASSPQRKKSQVLQSLKEQVTTTMFNILCNTGPLASSDDKILLIENINELDTEDQKQLTKIILSVHKDTNSQRLKFFLSFRVPHGKFFEASNLERQQNLQHLIMHSHVVFLNTPQSIKKYLERMHAEDIISKSTFNLPFQKPITEKRSTIITPQTI